MGQDVPQVTLRDGNVVPQLGFGTRRLPAADSRRLTEAAIAAGYRFIDTSAEQGNEDGIGRAIRGSEIERNAFAIASTLPDGLTTREATLRAFNDTMKQLDIEQLDLLTLGQPASADPVVPDVWKTLGELQQQGHVRAIGVTGLARRQLERLISDTGLTPALHRVTLHPHLQQRDDRGFHARRNIRLMSRHPLGPSNALSDATLAAIATKHGRSPAQVVLRWHLQDGLILAPSSTRPERIAENFAAAQTELDAEDMYRIEAIDGALELEPAG